MQFCEDAVRPAQESQVGNACIPQVYDVELPSGQKLQDVDLEDQMANPEGIQRYRVVGDNGERPFQPETEIEISKDGGKTWVHEFRILASRVKRVRKFAWIPSEIALQIEISIQKVVSFPNFAKADIGHVPIETYCVRMHREQNGIGEHSPFLALLTLERFVAAICAAWTKHRA